MHVELQSTSKFVEGSDNESLIYCLLLSYVSPLFGYWLFVIGYLLLVVTH